jgi:hypothetical protein
MQYLQGIGIVAGIIIAVSGAIGGTWSLIDRVKAFKDSKRRHGERAVSTLVMRSERSDEGTSWDYLIAGDLMTILRGALKKELKGRLMSLERVGDYYRCTVVYPPDVEPGIKEERIRFE